MASPAIHREIEAIWRIESAKVIATLARFVRDVGLAEDLAQDALVAALEQWPVSGVPRSPGAWLTTTGKRRAIYQFRRNQRFRARIQSIGYELALTGEGESVDFDEALDEDRISDDLLRLIFTACHPSLSMEARVALTLRLLGGLTTEEIARAFLVPEPTVAQRIVQAKRTLGREAVAFEPPDAMERSERLPAVLEVIYLIFNEGYSATSGTEWIRPPLCDEALRLVRILAELVPGEPEVHGLAALLEIQASRLRARIGPDGEPVLLLDQDRSRWDRMMIARGFAALDRAARLRTSPGPYVIQAQIAACHARALTADQTDWGRIAELYEELNALVRSPVVELNRAVAVSMAIGPEAALAIVDRLVEEPSLARYHLLPAVRGDLLFKLGRLSEARGEFDRAMELAQNEWERTLLRARIDECDEDEGRDEIRSAGTCV
ncbi:MAG: RNA polymerase sigma factor [Chloroflexi bacterium]|nr:RNA polymerase sigma factor [Chloroflexota bacterium]MQC17402.1 RNA polymerase sigma factor [Chloroflexota bacterium]